MRRSLLALLPILTCSTVSPLAAQTAIEAPPTQAPAVQLPAEPALDTDQARALRLEERRQRLELNRRLEAAVEQSRRVVAGLSEQAATITDANRRLDLDRRIAQVKRELQLDLLRIQAQFAREHGRVAQAEAIEAQVKLALEPARKPLVGSTRSTRANDGGAR